MGKSLQNYSFICGCCGHSFTSKRSDAKFCSVICRNKLSRQRQAMQREYSQFVKYLKALEKTTDHVELGYDAYNLIARIQKRVCGAVVKADGSRSGKRIALEAQG